MTVHEIAKKTNIAVVEDTRQINIETKVTDKTSRIFLPLWIDASEAQVTLE